MPSQANSRRKAAAKRKLHRVLRIISGSAAGARLWSAQGDQTRPMMEKVRGAVFSMIQSQVSSNDSAQLLRLTACFAAF